jgi:hypothetical protein
MDTRGHRLIGEILSDLRFITLDQVEEALRKQAAYPEVKLGQILVCMNFLTSEQLEKGLQLQKNSK